MERINSKLIYFNNYNFLQQVIFGKTMSNAAIGYSWVRLELRGRQNARAIKTPRPFRHSFVVEEEENGQTLLSFMKNVPVHEELLPPPSQALSRLQQMRSQPSSIRLNNNVQVGSLQRQTRQTMDTAMTLNAFSDLEAIAEMGAGTDDGESQVSEQSNRSSSMLADNCSPNLSNSLVFNPQQNSAGYEHRMRIDQSSLEGSQEMQQSPADQRHQHHRFGMNVVYRQQQLQQQKRQTMPNIRPIDSNQMQARHSSTDVFNFIPEQQSTSPFDDLSSFGGGTAQTQSPTGGTRRRGRGRKGANLGDRQPSTSSSMEHEGTPDSPSDFTGSIRKQRGTGARRPRKPRKPMNMGFEQDAAQQQQQYQSSDFSAIFQRSISDASHSFITSPTEEELRTNIMQAYERDFCESSSDDQEMDPPPPPKNLMQINESAEERNTGKTHGSGIGQTAGLAKNEPKISQRIMKMEEESQTLMNINQQIDQGTAEHKPLILRDIKLVSAPTSSTSSSPSLSQMSEQSNGEQKTGKVKAEVTELQPKQVKEVRAIKEEPSKMKPFNDLYDNELSSNVKNTSSESNRPKLSIELQNVSKAKTLKDNSNRESKESSTKKKSSESAKRQPIVLKIKPPKDRNALSTSAKHSSSSSSPSSTSSMPTAIGNVTASTSLHQSHEHASVARLSGVPPSKYKQQSLMQQQRLSTKRPLTQNEEAPTKTKKSKKTGDEKSSSTLQRTNSKGQKERDTTTKSLSKEELPPSLSHIASHFPSLKNFKIPKVVEASESNLSQNSQNKGSEGSAGSSAAVDKGQKSKQASNHNSDPHERRSGGGSKQASTHNAKQSASHYQSDRGGGSYSSQQSQQYNRQHRPPKQHSRHGPPPPPEPPRKYSQSSSRNERPSTTNRPSANSSRFPPQQHHNRELPPPHQQTSPFSQSQYGWQTFPSPTYQSTGAPQSQYPARTDWPHQNPNCAGAQIEANSGHQLAMARQEKQNIQGETAEDRNDNSPSGGSGLQIVDED